MTLISDIFSSIHWDRLLIAITLVIGLVFLGAGFLAGIALRKREGE